MSGASDYLKELQDANDRIENKLKAIREAEERQLREYETAILALVQVHDGLLRACDAMQKDYDEYIEEMSIGGKTYRPW